MKSEEKPETPGSVEPSNHLNWGDEPTSGEDSKVHNILKKFIVVIY